MASTLGQRIRERRVALSLTQTEAAARAGISPTTWRNLELGRQQPRTLTGAAIARSLEVADLDHLHAPADLSAVRRVADVLEEQPTAEAMLAAFHALCRELVPEAGVSRVTYLVREGGRVSSVATHGDPQSGPPVGSSLTMEEEPLLHRILVHGHTLILQLDETTIEANFVRRHLHDAGIRSVLGLPLRTGGRIAAMLLLSSRRHHAFEGLDLANLEATGRVVVHVLSSLLVFAATSEPRHSGLAQPTDVLRLAARLTSLAPHDRALVGDLVERLRPRGAG